MEGERGGGKVVEGEGWRERGGGRGVEGAGWRERGGGRGRGWRECVFRYTKAFKDTAKIRVDVNFMVGNALIRSNIPITPFSPS